MKTRIKLNTADDVYRFVSIARKCSFDIDVQYHHFILDGKSLVGMMSVDLRNSLIVYHNDTNPVFENMLKDYEIKG